MTLSKLSPILYKILENITALMQLVRRYDSLERVANLCLILLQFHHPEITRIRNLRITRIRFSSFLSESSTSSNILSNKSISLPPSKRFSYDIYASHFLHTYLSKMNYYSKYRQNLLTNLPSTLFLLLFC